MKVLVSLLVTTLMSFAVISCGTNKSSVSEQRDVKLDIRANEVIESTSLFSTVDSLGARLRRELIYKITTMSPPDSSGRQYPITIEEGTLTEEYGIESLSKVDSSSVAKVERDTTMQLVDKSIVKSKVETDSRPLRIPWWIWVAGLRRCYCWGSYMDETNQDTTLGYQLFNNYRLETLVLIQESASTCESGRRYFFAGIAREFHLAGKFTMETGSCHR